ncbi:MAG TPA: A24 family peptidase [Propionibacteriaceae bacterium]|jgi:leader peptidase (prepilin peptidase)/N-methyltransferase
MPRLPPRSLLCLPVLVAVGWVVLASTSVADGAAGPAALLFVVLAAALAWIDLDVHRLPDELVLGGAVAITALLAAAAATTDHWHQLGVAVAAAGVLTVSFLGLAIFGSMGLGDVKLAGLAGLVLGWFGWSTVLIGVVVAFSGAALVGAGLLLTRRSGWTTHVAFGPALALGAVVAVMASPYTG